MIDAITSTSPHQIRLENEYRELGSVDKLADKYGVNVRYVWEFLKKGIVPPNKVCKKLGMFDPDNDLLYTRTRRERLDEIARSKGHKSWCALETHVLKESEK